MSNHSGDAPTWITCTYLEKMLQNSLKDDSIQVTNFKIGPGSSVGDNYVAQVFRIECECTVGPRNLTKSIIAKAVPNTDLAEELKKGFNLYKTEMKMMSETLPLLYEELRAKLETERFFPQFYKLDSEKETIFMEDLKPEGYVLADKNLSLDLDHVLLVIKSLAKMHASGYLLLRKNPDYKNNYWDYFYNPNNTENANFMKKMVDGHMVYLLKYIDRWAISEEDKEKFRKLDVLKLIMDGYARKDSSFNTILHGDCWLNNMMFKYENGKPVSVKLLDFQVSNYNSIGLDLNYFLFTSAKEYVKLNHLDDVFKTYHDTFLSITGEIEGFTVERVRKEFVERLGFGLGVALTFRPGVTSDVPFDFEANIDGKVSEKNDQMYRNEQYISEASKLLPIFKKHGVFR